MTCTDCGATLELGSWPFCPHGRGCNSIEDATWPGGRVFEHLGPEPVRCDSPADLKRELKARNLEEFVRHTAGDPHTRSWATMDPYTLENGRILAERQAHTRASSEPGADPAICELVAQAFREQGS